MHQANSSQRNVYCFMKSMYQEIFFLILCCSSIIIFDLFLSFLQFCVFRFFVGLSLLFIELFDQIRLCTSDQFKSNKNCFIDILGLNYFSFYQFQNIDALIIALVRNKQHFYANKYVIFDGKSTNGIIILIGCYIKLRPNMDYYVYHFFFAAIRTNDVG